MEKARNYIVTAAGILLLAVGLCLMVTTDSRQAFVAALPYVCIGVGSGILGHGISNIFADRARHRNPGLQDRIKIAENDERNMAIANRAKAKAYDLMIFVFAALMIAFTLMGMDVASALLFVFAYLAVQGYAFYCRCRYEREM